LGTIGVVVPLSFLEFLIQIHIILVGQEISELLLVRSVGPFHVAIELGWSGRDVDMSDSVGLDISMI
jgi:hypothetical protein